ncbi:cytochrome P450 [Aspergillus cavernicola]|uniref:Cytochrome P450 n=1 Tax=Aspergillus cavernicola TaxID=176166 RepID=A0ABR4IAP5_9EURO
MISQLANLQYDVAMLITVACILLTLRYLLAALFSPLRDVKGPTLARYTRQLEHVTVALHKQYGSIVRLAPNRYSISDPTAIRTIYCTGSKFSKSDYYVPFGTPLDHKDVFSETSNEKHASERRKISNMYAMSSLVSYELFIDKHGRVFDLFTWMQFYVFDVIGEITLGQSFGLLEAGHNKDGLLHAVHVGLISYGSSISARLQGVSTSNRKDFLAKCIELRKAGKLDQSTINNMFGTNIGAGSDTTRISMCAIIYFLIKHPNCLQKLRNLSNTVTFQEAQRFPYLQATIKEALRLHAAVGQILSRVVPEGSAQIAARYFPQGTAVGVNAWVIHNDESIWGKDVHEFRPERWLVDKEQLSFLDQNYLAFGAGSRTCIGKNISLLEMKKLLPQLVQRFDFAPAGDSQWTTSSGWFVKQSIQVKVIDRGRETKMSGSPEIGHGA